jgi:tetratricopeptide (TPR) repeat protein
LSKRRRNRPDRVKSTRTPGDRRFDTARISAASVRGRWRATGLISLALLAAVVITLLIRSRMDVAPGALAGGRVARPSSTPVASFIGAAKCATCHVRESNLWRASHHQAAMLVATPASVLGDFNNVNFTNDSVTSTFFRQGPRFMVRTDGPDGRLHDYEIKYTFGIYPLQQYLIAMTGGRLQALGIAWDSRPADHGGQRWFFLLAGQRISNRDPLHWTGLDQNWNFMCADCHSTNVRKNYNASAKTFSTSYAELDVSCEACHGPGSLHIAWSKRQRDWASLDASKGLLIALDERHGIAWSVAQTSGEVQRSVPRASQREIQMCARCHSRRSQIHEDYVHGQPVGDDYRVALLDDDLYFPDGQIKGEDYEYGSFIQSRMYHAGVTCSDCHEPHSLKLRAEGNGVCLQCHLAQTYASPKHHFHQSDSAGAQCVNCHMPSRTYMMIDPRRDHSLRIPRPDLSVRFGIPNACTNCHTDRSSQWAATAVSKWYQPPLVGLQRFADTLHDAVEGAPDARHLLPGLITNREQPAIARATALTLLSAWTPDPGDTSLTAAISDDSPLVRRAAARALANADPRARIVSLAPLLHDPVRDVRLEAAEVLAGKPSESLPPQVVTELNHATDEYIAAQRLNADRPEAHLNLGLLDARQNQFNNAETEFKLALSLDPSFVPATVDLADLYRSLDRDRDGERLLDDAIGRAPNDASLRYALGLLLVRAKRGGQALDSLAAAAHLDPGNARYAYVYAIALHDGDQLHLAISTLEASLRLHPYYRDSLGAVVNFLGESGDAASALPYAQRLLELEPANPQLRQLVEHLSATSGPPHDNHANGSHQ